MDRENIYLIKMWKKTILQEPGGNQIMALPCTYQYIEIYRISVKSWRPSRLLPGVAASKTKSHHALNEFMYVTQFFTDTKQFVNSANLALTFATCPWRAGSPLITRLHKPVFPCLPRLLQYDMHEDEIVQMKQI